MLSGAAGGIGLSELDEAGGEGGGEMVFAEAGAVLELKASHQLGGGERGFGEGLEQRLYLVAYLIAYLVAIEMPDTFQESLEDEFNEGGGLAGGVALAEDGVVV